MSGCDAPIIGISTSTCVADKSVNITIAANTLLVDGHPTTVADASHVLASCCPPTDAVITANDACPANIVAPADGRRARAMLFFYASAKGSQNLPTLQEIRT